MSTRVKMEDLADSLKTYICLNVELNKLEAIERSAMVGSNLISTLLISSIGVIFLLCASLGLGFYLSAHFGNNYSGFVIEAAFYFCLGILFILYRKKLIEKPMRSKIIRTILIK